MFGKHLREGDLDGEVIDHRIGVKLPMHTQRPACATPQDQAEPQLDDDEKYWLSRPTRNSWVGPKARSPMPIPRPLPDAGLRGPPKAW